MEIDLLQIIYSTLQRNKFKYITHFYLTVNPTENYKVSVLSRPMFKLKVFILTLLCTFTLSSVAQDTVVVQTLDFSKTTRDTTVQFPDGSDSYSKILMKYAMRCKNALVSDGTDRNRGCGEWDYSCNTYIVDPTKADSLQGTTSEYTIDGYSGTTFNYKETALFDYYRNTSISTTVLSSTDVQTAQLGIGTNWSTLGIPGTLAGQPARVQHLYTAQELLNAGLSPGEIWGIQVEAQNAVTVSDLRINVQEVAKDSLSLNDVTLANFTNVFTGSQDFVPGANEMTFHSPYVWDGVSNILLDFTSSQSVAFQELVIKSTQQDTSRSILGVGRDYLLLNGTNYAESESYAGVLGSQNRTCEAWIKTTGANQEIVSWGKNATSQKWVFRTNTDGSLRVEVNGGGANATTPVNDGQWHHVSCVLNGNNVTDIKLYVDGELETISDATNIAVNTTSDINVRISRGVNDRYFVGGIDDVRIWDIALSQAQIQEMMRKASVATDANWNNLKAYFKFEDLADKFTKDESSTGANLTIVGKKQSGKFRAPTLFKDFLVTKNRIDIRWKTGNFMVSNDTTYTLDQIPHSSNIVRKFGIAPAYNTTTDDVIEEIESNERWNADDDEVYYDEEGNEYDRKSVTADGTIEIEQLKYTRRWASVFEIMSFVTPYGIGLDLGAAGKTWTFDVTDFSPLLRGDKRMFLSRGGQNQEEMDIQFLFIKGTPSREVIAIDQIWPTQQYSANYTQILANDVYFPPVAYKTIDSAKGFKIRSAITGHGQEGEFIPRNHFITANDQTFTRSVWKTCGDNPVYPQGGTWIYDRAGWCPGMATDVAEYDITGEVNGGETITLDYGLDEGSGDSRYIVNNQIVSYGEYNFGYDLGIEDIIEPSNKIEHARDNPTCASPKMLVRNNGKNKVFNMTIDYWVNDRANKRTFTWPCDLSTGEVETVYFPTDNSIYATGKSTNNIFYAEIMAIEGNTTADEYKPNNIFRSPFELPEVYPQEIALFYRTNNAANQTSIQVIDEWNTVVFDRNNLANSTTYRDTLRLGLGCYKLIIADNGGNGLSFFANGDGAGFFRMSQVGGGNLKIINPDFGNSTQVQFTVVHPLDVPQVELDLGHKLYPNPSSGKFTLSGGDLQGAEHLIYNSQGQAVSAPFQNLDATINYDLTNYPSGIYYVHIQKNGLTWSQKFIKL